MSNGANLILQAVQPTIGLARPVTAYNQGQQDMNTLQQQALNNQTLQQQLAQNAIMNPLEAQLMQQRLDAGQFDMNQAQQLEQQQAQARQMAMLGQAAKVIKPFVEKGDLIGAASTVNQLEKLGFDSEFMDEFNDLISKGDLSTISQGIAAIETMNNAQNDAELIPSSARMVRIGDSSFMEYETKTGGTKRFPISGEIAKKTTGETVEEERAGEAGLAGAKQRAKLMADLDLKPSIQARVKEVEERVKRESARKDEERSDDKAFRVYESAMSGLFDALGDTATGPIVGWLPALTEEQQIADGAVAAFAPVLKGVFRTAGEGTFTDKDQELLINMLPTRRTAPGARAAQLATVDAIVRSKMGQPVNVNSSVLGREVSMAEVFQEAIDNNMTVDEVKRELGIE